MNTRIIAAAALGGLGLVAVPTATALALQQGASVTDAVTVQAQNAEQRRNTDGGTGQGMMSGGMMGGWDDADDDTTGGGAAGRGAGGNGNSSSDDWRGGMMGGGMMGADDDAALALVDGSISDEDAAALAYMVEEEKLAHDLYEALGEEWGLRVFDMIAASETQHTDSVAALLEAYGLDDPTDGLAAGEFADPDLQDLYDSLLADGLASEVDALMVGALVEETDIADLQARATDEASVALVFEHLESGSDNHLRAFVRNLEALGVTYDAQALSSAEVDDILGR